MATAGAAFAAGAVGLYADLASSRDLRILAEYSTTLLAGSMWVALVADMARLRFPANRAWAPLLAPLPIALHGVTSGRTVHLVLDAMMILWIAVLWRRGDLKRLRG
jgi:hypothetical protein